MKIRFDHPCSLRLDLQPGDSIDVRAPSASVLALTTERRLDGETVAHVVEDDSEELADASDKGEEKAVTGRGRRGERERAPHVS